MTPVDVVRALLDCFSRGDLPGVMTRLDDDVVFQEYEHSVVPFAGQWTGKGGAQRFFEALASIQVTRFEPQDFLAVSDRVFVPLRWAGTVTRTGKTFESELLMDWTVLNGKVTRYRAYEDLSVVAEAFR